MTTLSAGSADPALLDPHFDSLPARVFGVLRSPRATLTAVVSAPRWAGVLVLTFLISTVSSAALLQTEVGRLALVDQWERTASAFGQNVDDRQYAALEDASANGPAYAAISSFVSGPLLTFGIAALLLAVFNGALGGAATYSQLLAITAHAGVILALRQVVAAPMNYARETLASPTTLVQFFTMLDEASPVARFLGVIDLFVVWWIVVLAIGMSVLYRRHAASRSSSPARTSRSRSWRRSPWRCREERHEAAHVDHHQRARPAGRRRRRRAHLAQPQQPSRRHGRSRPRARPGRDRLGVGKDSAEAPGQRVGDDDGTRHAARGAGRPAGEGGTVPARDRSALARRTARARRGERGRGALVAAGGDDGDRTGAGEPRAGAAVAEAPAGSLEGRPHHARGARARAERRHRSARPISRRGSRRRRRASSRSSRSRRVSRRRATT